MPVFYKAGSILPILLHNYELSLLRALKNNIGLEVYPTSAGVAQGSLLLDDGWSTKAEESKYAFNLNEEGVLKIQGLGD